MDDENWRKWRGKHPVYCTCVDCQEQRLGKKAPPRRPRRGPVPALNPKAKADLAKVLEAPPHATPS